MTRVRPEGDRKSPRRGDGGRGDRRSRDWNGAATRQGAWAAPGRQVTDSSPEPPEGTRC